MFADFLRAFGTHFIDGHLGYLPHYLYTFLRFSVCAIVFHSTMFVYTCVHRMYSVWGTF